MRKMKLLICSALIVLTFLISCTKENNDNQVPELKYSKGVFITNEGPFQTGTGTISFFNRDTKVVEQKIFQKVNGYPLGNIVQSMEIFNGKAYIVVNNANKVEVVNAGTFESICTINNLTLPRYFLSINPDKAYISCWDNNVAVIDLNKNKVIKEVPTKTGPDKMLKVDDKVFVLNAGGFSIDSTITVIDCNSDTVITTIQVEKKPTGIQLDKKGKVWVICSGRGWNGYPQSNDTKGHLICINPYDFSIEKDIPFFSKTEHPEELIINKLKNKLYYNDIDGVYEFDITSNELNKTPLIKRNKMFYGLGFDNIDNYIYASDAMDYVQNGWVFIYNPDNGEIVDSIKVGIIPGEFCFK